MTDANSGLPDPNADDLDLDLTPASRPGGDSTGGINLRNWLIVGALVLIGGAVMFQALTNARVFFYNVDEAVDQQAELDDRTFRMQGTVVTEPAKANDGTMTFAMSFNGVEADVRHVGAEPSDLFRVGERVVAEGSWDDDGAFRSSQLLVKHSEQYVEDNPDRLETDPGYEPSEDR